MTTKKIIATVGKPRKRRTYPKIEALRTKVQEINSYLPGTYCEIVLKHYPKYNTPKLRQKIYDVKNCRNTDKEITEILIKIYNRELF